jgi:hypothetical protein
VTGGPSVWRGYFVILTRKPHSNKCHGSPDLHVPRERQLLLCHPAPGMFGIFGSPNENRLPSAIPGCEGSPPPEKNCIDCSTGPKLPVCAYCSNDSYMVLAFRPVPTASILKKQTYPVKIASKVHAAAHVIEHGEGRRGPRIPTKHVTRKIRSHTRTGSRGRAG